jgi:GAF domain-containing protein
MTATTSTEALARAASALVQEHDVTDVLLRLLSDATDALGGEGGGLLLVSEGGGLELLAATSHAATELELYQVQEHAGPCFDAVVRGEVVTAWGRDALLDRWPEIGRAIVAAGYESVTAYPLRWRDQVLGGMNVFHAAGAPAPTGDLDLLGTAFADIATLVIVTPVELSTKTLQRRAQEALAGRTVIEQAKGVVAFREGVDVGVAYERLVATARDRGVSVTDMARIVLASTARGAVQY